MPRAADIYTLPPGIEGVPDTTIESADWNTLTSDVAFDLNAARPVVAGGTGATSAATARYNLQAERAMQAVTNYDSHVWESGSFWSAIGATAAPGGGAYGGTCVILNVDYIILEARDVQTGALWVRRRDAGVWSAWSGEGTGDYVNVSGDTMTGNLQVSSATPSFILNKNSSGQSNVVLGKTGGVERWYVIPGDNVPELGGNTGSDFAIYRVNDDGSFGGQPFTISRATGLVHVALDPVNPTGVATKNYADVVAGNAGADAAAASAAAAAASAAAAAASANADMRVLRSGDTMSGNLTAPGLHVNSAADGQYGLFRSGVMRWAIHGIDAGDCDLQFHRYGVGGAYAGMPLSISNASGDATFAHSVNVAAFLSCPYAAAASSPSTGAVQVPNGGIGTRGLWVAAPTVHNVSVFGGSSGSGAQVEVAWGNSDVGYHGLVMRDMTTGGLGNFQFFLRDDTFVLGGIKGTGSAVVYNTTSDANLKENIRPAREVFDSKAALRAVQVSHFKWKGSDREEVGLIAQQVNETLPGIVTPPGPHVKIAEDGTETMGETPWMISYASAVPYVIDVVQQQSDEIDAITGELATAKETINKLVARIEVLERKLKQ